jgi:putative peptidoglycan lipid II flippase
VTDTAGGPDLARSTATMTVFTLLSRVTGVIRNVVVVGVLGVTFLGNTYQSANTVPNLLFELVAAGVLQAVLIPTLVDLIAEGSDDEADHVARSVLGLAGAALAVLAGIGFLAAPFVMRLLVAGVNDPHVRDQQVHLGTILLWFFLPQVVLYASNMVATGLLNARGHFAVPVAAPLLNNIVVTTSYLLFAWMRHGAAPSLDLTGAQTLVLGLGTTLGVVAFCAAPVLMVVRGGTSLRPSFDWHHPGVRRVARLGGWAAAFLAATNVLLLVVLVLANNVEGGVVAWNLGFTIFLLPHSLVALPILTALFPTMARHAGRDETSYHRTVTSGLRAIAYLVVPAGAAMLALSLGMARVLQFGNYHRHGVTAVAAAVAAFGPGLVGYGIYLFLVRAFYARGDTRTPALVNLGVVAGGAVVMAASFALVDGDARVAALAGSHSAAYLVGAFVLFWLTGARATAVARSLGAVLVAAVVAGAAMWLIGQPLAGAGRIHSLVELVVAGGGGLAVYTGVAAALGGPRPREVPALLRGHG